uniref:Uncharacterized protein LOC116955294 isoform X3 n=1 Tax=Petromyzon marinus TaxID=7757 RepID=A0AAJ7UC99_PETMA|nr:uncharacterized protein LOC116955294 isoform X3 [Petromyzon marinus]
MCALLLLLLCFGVPSAMGNVQLIGGTVRIDVVTLPAAPPLHQQQRHQLRVVSTLVLDGAAPCALLASSPWLCWLGCTASWNQSYHCAIEGGGGSHHATGGGWHLARATFEVDVATSGWAALWNLGCCWAEDVLMLQANGTLSYATAGDAVSWMNAAFVSLDVRGDTGRPNASPRAAVIPLVRLNNRCNATLRVRVVDPDRDRVRCAFGDPFGVPHGGVPHGGVPHGVPHGVTEGSIENAVMDSDACEIRVGRPVLYPTGRFAVVMTVSDFSSPGGAPLSLVPLQFLLEFVESPLPCSSQPTFVPDSPPHGAELSATIARAFTMSVHLSVSAGSPRRSVHVALLAALTLDGVRTSAPASDPSRPGVFLATVTWTPRPRDLGSNWLCLYAEDSEGRQSEVRCVDVVVKAAGDLDVVCAGERMSVTMRREALQGYGAVDLALAQSGPGCALHEEGRFVTFDIGLLSCGTAFEEDSKRFIFTQRLRLQRTSDSVITYQIRKVDIVFQCILKRVMLLTSKRLRPGVELLSLSHAERGELHAAMRFYDAADFSRAYRDDDYPLRPSNFQRLYFECSLEGTNSSLGLVIVTQYCYATPSREPADPVRYSLVSRRCIAEKWVMNHTTQSWANRFSFLAFAFLDHPNQEVYLHCGVLACRRDSLEPDCLVRCPPPAPGAAGGRGERGSEGSGFVVLTGGPIVLPGGGRRWARRFVHDESPSPHHLHGAGHVGAGDRPAAAAPGGGTERQEVPRRRHPPTPPGVESNRRRAGVMDVVGGGGRGGGRGA